MEKNNMTAVEWLWELCEKKGGFNSKDLEQAKQIEKEQIMKAHNDGFLVYGSEYRTAEQYYNGTYGKE